jgi:hypothetical protein
VVARATEFGTREDDGPHFGAAPHLA